MAAAVAGIVAGVPGADAGTGHFAAEAARSESGWQCHEDAATTARLLFQCALYGVCHAYSGVRDMEHGSNLVAQRMSREMPSHRPDANAADTKQCMHATMVARTRWHPRRDAAWTRRDQRKSILGWKVAVQSKLILELLKKYSHL